MKQVKNPNWKQPRTCVRCGAIFVPNGANQKYCELNCLTRAQEEAQTARVYLVFERDNFKCIYCGRTSIEDGVKLHVDHIVPQSMGGGDTVSNLVTACQLCNISKGNRRAHIEKRILRVVARRNELRGIRQSITIKQIQEVMTNE